MTKSSNIIVFFILKEMANNTTPTIKQTHSCSNPKVDVFRQLKTVDATSSDRHSNINW